MDLLPHKDRLNIAKLLLRVCLEYEFSVLFRFCMIFTWITFDSSYFMVCLDVTWKGIFSSCNMITFWTLIGSIWMNSFYMVLQLNFWMPTIITQPTIEHIIVMVISDMFLHVLISSWYIVTLITFEPKGVPQNDFFWVTSWLLDIWCGWVTGAHKKISAL